MSATPLEIKSASLNLLAIETATEACSIAIWVKGAVWERHEVAPRRHATLALPWAEELLAQAHLAKSQLDAIAVGIGPGAFTGVRLAVALAQGIALGLDIPVIPVSTLAVLAASGITRTTPVGTPIVAAIDARMGEVYLGRFRSEAWGVVEAVGLEVLVSPDAAMRHESDANAIGIGTGFAAADGALARRLGVATAHHDALPRAAVLAKLAVREYSRGHAIAADALEPAYLRDRVALTLVEQGKA